ncbi:hypothetical protein SGM_6238 [Streptomyces griseoaurantiacus M045]|uniref:Uncharacterized protein n=1 Tax=Streptomyces griseoaurantiacus M045 TaxID=996637 RepID=F3NTD8_9ACTN|nr:hypothetical protein SGM_6238 [Streptomyces griseoaurantiacus M045]
MAEELQFLLGREVTADAEVGGVPDQGALEGDAQGAVLQLTGAQGHEGVPGEQAGAYGGPLRVSGGVVEVDLVDRADLDALAVERLAADQIAGVDVGLHGPVPPGCACREHHETACSGRRPLENRSEGAAGRLVDGRRPRAGESSGHSPGAPKEQILPGISQAPVPRGRGHSGKQSGYRRCPLSPTVKAAVPAEGLSGEALRSG